MIQRRSRAPVPLRSALTCLVRRYNDRVTAPAPEPVDPDTRAAMKRWLDTWKRLGPILEQERWDRVTALTDADAARDALWLFELWQPDWPTDEGEELLLHQRVLARAPRT